MVLGLGLVMFFLFNPLYSKAQIAQRGTATTNTNSATNITTLTINKPTGVVAGDVLIVNIVQNQTDNITGLLSNATGTGWTLIDGREIYNDGNQNNRDSWWGTILFRVVDGTEGAAFTFNLPNSRADMAIGSLVAFSGVDYVGGPFDVAPGTISLTNSTNATSTTITTATNNAAILMFGQGILNRSYSGWTTVNTGGLTELYDNGTNSGDDASVGAAWVIDPTAGASGLGTVTMSASNWNGAILIALSPCTAPIISSQSTVTQSRCIGIAFDPISVTVSGTGLSYQWYSNSTASTSGGTLISGATSSSYTPLSSSVGTTYYYSTITNSCGSTVTSAVSGPFVVTPNNTPGTITSNTFCQGSALGVVTQSTTGATGINAAAATNIPPGISVTWAANQITFSGTPTTPGTYSYTIPLTGGCGAINATGTITVNATPAISFQVTPGGTTCISGVAFGQMSVGTGFGYTYQWFSNTANNNTTGTAIPLATTNTYTPLNTTSGTLYYYLVVGSASCTSVTSPVSGAYIVNPNNTVSAPSATPTVCASSLITPITHTTTGATGIGTASGLPTGLTSSWAANTITISGTPTQTGVFNYTIPLTGGCSTVNATGTITVNAVPAITSQVTPGGTTCINSTAFGQMSVGTGFGYTYQWFSNTANNNTTGTAIPLATTDTYTPLNTTAGTLYYYVVVGSASCTSVTSPVSGAYIVNPNNTVSAPSATPTVCAGSPITAITHTTTGAAGIGTVSGLPTGLTASWAANTITISGTPTQTGVFNYTIPLTGGCSTLNATGTITVNAQAAIITPILGTQSRCINTAFAPISVGTGFGLTYQWFSNNTPDTVTPNLITGATSNSYTPLSNTAGTTYYYVVVTSATCGTTATSSPSGAFIVNPLPLVSFVSQPAVGNYCVDTDITYSTQPGQSNYVWTIPGVLGTDYTITSGGTLASNTVVIRWPTAGSKSVSVNYTDPNGCGATSPATSNSITIQKNTVTASSNPNPSACSTGIFPSITHTTTLATGIGTPTGLPLGLSAVWTGSALSGTITISGTVDPTVTPGPKPYSIPVTGGCGTVVAAGVIDIQPVYTINTISSVSPSNLGGAATITLTVSPAALTNGSYVVNYQMGLANPRVASNVTVNFTNGVGTFFSSAITNENLTSLTVNSIRKGTDPISCPVLTSTNNITFFGIQPKIYSTNGTFYVPAGIFQITMKVYGGGGGGGGGLSPSNSAAAGGGGGYSEQTISVVPGQPIGIFVGAGGAGQTASGTPAGNGGASWVTKDSSLPNPQTSSVAYAFGGGGANGANREAAALTGLNGSINQPGNIGGLPNTPTANRGGSGGKGGGPDGGNGGPGGSGNNGNGINGTPFGGGGGGARGNGIGGNGAGGYVIITYPLPPVSPCFKVIDDGAITGTTIIEYTCENQTWTAPEGLIEFSTFVGGGGGGGGTGRGSGGGGAGGLVSVIVPSGSPIGFPANATFTINAGQGGAGSSNDNVRGINGNPSSLTGTVNGTPISFTAGGGGGGGSENAITSGIGLNGASGGGGGANNTSEGLGGAGNGTGKAGGAGDFSTGQAFAGGGGGGIVEIGGEGKAAGLGQGEGGKGGNGVAIIMGDSTRYFGAGGGGVGFNFNGTIKVGLGGTDPNSIKIGGDGSVTTGLPGVDKTGSGGGAGRNVGSKGGNGVVYIYYFNYRILPVEFLYFNAIYQNSNRSGELKWATAKEWETSHFEIERSLNDTRNWTKVGEVNGQVYSDVPVEYSFTDLNLPASGGNIFYRLKQVDLKGDFQNSLTRAIQVEGLEGSTSWIAYPNPSSMGSSVTVDLLDKSGFKDEAIQIRISDTKGISTSYSVSSSEEVNDVVNSYLSQSRQGLHILQLFWGDRSEVIKLIRR